MIKFLNNLVLFALPVWVYAYKNALFMFSERSAFSNAKFTESGL
jgi:hypothetical protein